MRSLRVDFTDRPTASRLSYARSSLMDEARCVQQEAAEAYCEARAAHADGEFAGARLSQRSADRLAQRARNLVAAVRAIEEVVR